jgi:hypothetical protein
MADRASTSTHNQHHNQERQQELVAAWIQAQITRGEEIQRLQAQRSPQQTQTETQTHQRQPRQ